MNTLTISLVQMDIALGRPDVNLARGYELVAEAARRGSDIVVLPELWTTGYDLEHAAEHAARLGEGPFVKMAQWAREHGIWLTGSLLERWGDGFANCAPLFTPAGDMLGPYRKVHLFRLMSEHQYLRPGEATPIFDLPWGRTALAICYDLRFPELFRKYALDDVSLILMPAEWPHPRLHHWRTLIQARAIENQCIVAACNRVGTDNANRFFGHSMIVSPWGEIYIEGGEQEVLLTVRVNLSEVSQARQRIPILADRRPHLY